MNLLEATTFPLLQPTYNGIQELVKNLPAEY